MWATHEIPEKTIALAADIEKAFLPSWTEWS